MSTQTEHHIVSRNGDAIAEALTVALGRIFQPYVQADPLTSHAYGGTGLGLVVTKQLAEVMGGTIAVTSELDKGTTFTLWLPQAAAG